MTVKVYHFDTSGTSCKISSPRQPRDILYKAPLVSQLKCTLIRRSKKHSPIYSSHNVLHISRHSPLLRLSSGGRSLTRYLWFRQWVSLVTKFANTEYECPAQWSWLECSWLQRSSLFSVHCCNHRTKVVGITNVGNVWAYPHERTLHVYLASDCSSSGHWGL